MIGIIVTMIVAIVMGLVYETAYVMTCVQVASEGITFTEVAELKNFRAIASIVIFIETLAISLWLSTR